MRVLTFIEAITLACNVLPGLKNDMDIIRERAKGKAKDMQGIGRLGLVIPDPLLKILEEYKPELFQSDLQLKNKAWLKFIKHSDSKPFRVSSKL